MRTSYQLSSRTKREISPTSLRSFARRTSWRFTPLDDRVCSKVFVDPHICPHTAFRAWSRELLVGEDYNEIRVVAETGGGLRC
jgi:hypothetical protein